MIDETTDNLPVTTPGRKRQQPKRQPRGRIVSISRMQDGKPIQFGTFPEAVIGQPLEQNILPFIEARNFGFGEWKVDIRTAKGHFERSFDFTIEEPTGNAGRVTDTDAEDDFLDADSEDVFDPPSQPIGYDAASARAELKIMLQEQEIKHLREQRSSGQNESSLLMQMLQASHQQTLAMQQQHIEHLRSLANTPKEDATSQALKMMESALGMVTRARSIAEELAPESGGGEGGGSWLADGAKLLDSLGRNAAPFIPAIASALTQPANGQPNTPTPGGFPNTGTGEFADLAARARSAAKPTPEPPEKAEGATA